MPPAQVLLVDNGSLFPAATLRLREIAAALATKIGRPVAPVSLLHSSTVPPGDLNGAPAEILVPALNRRASAGGSDFLVVPLFFGLGGALTGYLPAAVTQLRERFPGLVVRLAPPLFEGDDLRLAQILAEYVRALPAGREIGSPRRVALVDHGSPARVVTAVRDQLAGQLAGLLGKNFVVAAASMERRPGAEFDFSGPLLAELLQRPGWNTGEVTVARQFFLPGRHAGPAGDVEKICRAAEKASPGLQTRATPLIGEHPLVVEILADRWRAGQETRPVEG